MSSTSLVPFQAKKKPITQPAIDNYTEIIYPLDFSFCNIEKIEDAVGEEPRLPLSPRGKGKQKQPEQQEQGAKYEGKSIKLNNNSLTNFEGFVRFIDGKFLNKLNVCWIDLSSNELPSIGAELTEFENLQILYLHGNHITDINQVLVLQPLKCLQKLTLHGNPVENTKNYRSIVLQMLPLLRCLDFSRVTKGDRRTAGFLGDSGIGKKKRGRGRDDEED